jgi:hypothetical protein
MDFGKLAAYLNLEKSKRYSFVFNRSTMVWKTLSGTFRFAYLQRMPGGFEWSKVFPLLESSKKHRFSFRRLEVVKRDVMGHYQHIDARMHFIAAPVCGV